MPRVDKRGQKYWKVREFYENENETTPNSSTPRIELPESVKNNVDKFHERLAKEEKANPNPEPIQNQGEPNVN